MGYTQQDSPLKIKDAAYEKQNKKMRKENPGMGKRLTSGTSPRRTSFACRFAGMKGPMKEANGEPTKKAMALKNGVLVVLALLVVFVKKINLKSKYKQNEKITFKKIKKKNFTRRIS